MNHFPLAPLGLLVLVVHASAQGRANAHEGPGHGSDFGPSSAHEAAVESPPPTGLSASDWAVLRAACEADRHAVVAVGGAHAARNPGQRWSTHFDGRGFLTQPDAGAWTWGLELERYGFDGAERALTRLCSESAHGPRMTYVWDEILEEWWLNDERGLEHGYTLTERPAWIESSGPLTFSLAVRGNLRPIVEDDRRGVTFVDADGSNLITYAGLVVFDADGTKMPASFELENTRLVLRIDERGARYPLTIDPIAQRTYFKASNTDPLDNFGAAVAVWGNTVVVGAPGEASSANGVNGNQSDDSAAGAGAAYVFVRNGTSWSQQAYLKASNSDANDGFGASISMSGDTVVIGASKESSGVGSNQFDESAPEAGAAYVFTRTGTTWSQQAYLKASNIGAHDRFGGMVSVSGDTLVVGAWAERSSATGVNGNQFDDSKPFAGAAYVFVRSGTTWSQQAYLKATNTDANDYFGTVAVSGDTIAVGAFYESSDATGVNGDQTNNGHDRSGAVYVYVRSGATWTPQAYIKASNTDAVDQFGVYVSLSGDTLAVGAVGESSNATGVNGNQADNSAFWAGAVYVFVRNGTSWSQQAYLKASNTGGLDVFGASVVVSGDTLVVGAPWESSSATGVDGDPFNDDASQSGAAYVFARSGSTWSQQAYVKSSNSGAQDNFGLSLALSGNRLVVGAYQEDGGAQGVNGFSNENAVESGAAYEFVLYLEPLASCFGDGSATACPCGNASTPGAGEGCSNSLGFGARLGHSGIPSLSGDTLVLQGVNMPNGSALYFQGNTTANGGAGTAFGDGLRCIGGTIVRLGTKVNVGNASQFPAIGDPSISARTAAQGSPISIGSTRHYQVWYRNAAAYCTPHTFNLSNGLAVTWSS